jgi:hypothetical protein
VEVSFEMAQAKAEVAGDNNKLLTTFAATANYIRRKLIYNQIFKLAYKWARWVVEG